MLCMLLIITAGLLSVVLNYHHFTHEKGVWTLFRSGSVLCLNPLNIPRATFSEQGYGRFYFVLTRTTEGEAGSVDPASGEAGGQRSCYTSAESHSWLTAHSTPPRGRVERKQRVLRESLSGCWMFGS